MMEGKWQTGSGRSHDVLQMNCGTQLAFSFLYSSEPQSGEWCHVRLWWVLLPLLIQCKQFLTGRPRYLSSE